MNAPSIITIGNFDGVHRGHQAIIHRAQAMADARGLVDERVVAVTFDPFPADVLWPENAAPRLTSIDQRVDALKHAGACDVVVLKPTPELLGMSAEAFIRWLIDTHDAVGFVEGVDFAFGHKRSGNMQMLAQMGERDGFAVAALPRVETRLSDQQMAPISSSLIRWLIGRGRVEDAATCMGRSFEIVAQVVKGEQRGRTIGVPTINLDPNAYAHHIVPTDGVYAGHAKLDGDPTPIPAAISVGLKPTFGHDQLTIEAHLVGFQSDNPDALYGQTVCLAFDRWLRDQYPFPGVDALKQQLQRDIQAAAVIQ